MNTVVATWHTPPPMDGTSWPFSMAWPSRNPRCAVRGPTTWLNENVAPGWMIFPSRMRAMRWTLKIRFADDTPMSLVNTPTASVMWSALAWSVVNVGCARAKPRRATLADGSVASAAAVMCRAVAFESRAIPERSPTTRAWWPSTAQVAFRAGRRRPRRSGVSWACTRSGSKATTIACPAGSAVISGASWPRARRPRAEWPRVSWIGPESIVVRRACARCAAAVVIAGARGPNDRVTCDRPDSDASAMAVRAALGSGP